MSFRADAMQCNSVQMRCNVFRCKCDAMQFSANAMQRLSFAMQMQCCIRARMRSAVFHYNRGHVHGVPIPAHMDECGGV
eukprot:3705655-Pleurochrysis_carterae.AAC.1